MNINDVVYKVNKENLCASFSFGDVKKSNLNPWINKHHFHSSFEIQYILSGNAYITTSIESKLITANSFCVIPPNTEHFISTANDETAEKLAIRFDFSYIKKSHEFDFYKYVSSILSNLSYPTIVFCNDAQNYIEKLIFLSNSANETNNIQICCLLLLMLVSLCESIKKNSLHKGESAFTTIVSKNDMYSAKIEGYIVRNYDKKISLKSLSNELSLSTRQCERIIKQYFNMDFRNLLLKQRMVVARQLINERVYTLEEISEKCGYCSYAGFYKAFKQYYKSSPNKYFPMRI